MTAVLRHSRYRNLLLDVWKSGRRCSPVFIWWLPLLFTLVWMGFGARNREDVCFYGLFPVDFCQLSGGVALVKMLTGLPLASVAGLGSLHYHWFFFTVPAWLTDFCGLAMPCANALVLCNWLAANLLVLALIAVIRRTVPEDRHRWLARLTIGVVVFAPLITYTYQFGVKLIGSPWLSLGTRNNLLMSVVNSMVAFGNNSTAVAMILTGALLLEEWNRQGRVAHGFVAVVFLILLPGYSATLTLTMAVVLACRLLSGKVKHLSKALVIAAPMGLVGLIALCQLNVLGGENSLGFSFDRGQFFQNILIAGIPLWALVACATRRHWRPRFFELVVLAGIVVPECPIYSRARDHHERHVDENDGFDHCSDMRFSKRGHPEASCTTARQWDGGSRAAASSPSVW